MVIYGDACGSDGQQFLFYIHDLYLCCHLCSASLSDVIWKTGFKDGMVLGMAFCGILTGDTGICFCHITPGCCHDTVYGRAGAQDTFSIMYPLSYYRKLLYGFLIGGSTYWSELGYTGIVLLAVLLLLFGGRKNRVRVPDLYL